MSRNTKSTTAVQEDAAFVEIGGYVHQDGGQVRTKMYVSDINKSLKVDASELTKQMKKVRVTMNVTEDKGVTNNQVYEKDITMTQEVIDGDSPTARGTTTSESKYGPTKTSESSPSGTAPDPSPLQVLKNFVDNIAADNRMQWILIGCAIALGAVALGIAVMR